MNSIKTILLGKNLNFYSPLAFLCHAIELFFYILFDSINVLGYMQREKIKLKLYCRFFFNIYIYIHNLHIWLLM